MALTGSGASLDTDLNVSTENGDHDVFAHYAPKDEVTRAMVEGIPIVALCGKVWIPFRNPEKYPV
jgi:hypothetical protein